MIPISPASELTSSEIAPPPQIPGLAPQTSTGNIEVKTDLPDYPDLDQAIEDDPANQTDSFHKGGTGAGTEQVRPASGSANDGFVPMPYCGHVQSGGEKCEQCHGLFEPLSRRATQISMGPWFIRDKNKPFMPGFSYTILQKMIRSGKIRETTVLRGPTTRQFWSVAKNIPGIAHHLGVCHSCGKPLENAGTNGSIPGVSPVEPPNKCPHCGVLFPNPTERNEMGLMYKSENEARQAKVALDRELDALFGTPQPQPATSPAPGSTSSMTPAPGTIPLAGNNPGSPAPRSPGSPGHPAAPGSAQGNDLLSQILGPINQWQNSEGTGADATAPTQPATSTSQFGMPNLSGLPGTPPQALSGNLATPNTPNIPNTHGTPVPGATGVPSVPVVPGNPGNPGNPGTPGTPGSPGNMPMMTQTGSVPGTPGGQNDLLGSVMGAPNPATPAEVAGVGMPNPLANAAPGIPASQPKSTKSSISNMTWLLIILNVLLVGCLIVIFVTKNAGGKKPIENTTQNETDNQNAGSNSGTGPGGEPTGQLPDDSSASGAGDNSETGNSGSGKNPNENNQPIQPGISNTPLFSEPDLGNQEITTSPEDYVKWEKDLSDAIDLASTKPVAALKKMKKLAKPSDPARLKILQENIKLLEDYIKKAKENDPKFMGL